MSRVLFFFLFYFFLFSQEPNWTSDQEVVLKKDQEHKMTLLIGNSDVREFRFHWTLYVDEGLVFLANYDGFNHQSILYNTYRKNAFRIGLNKEGKKGISPYLVVFFKSFNSDSKEAVFKIVTYGDVYVQ